MSEAAGLSPLGSETAGITGSPGAGADQGPAVIVNGGQGVQVIIGGQGWQNNQFGARDGAAVTLAEFRSDLRAMLEEVAERARGSGLPPHLASGADLLQMARTVRLLGRVRHPQGEGRPRSGGTRREEAYALPSERDERADEPPQSWEQVAAEYDRLAVVADPGMGKSWLLRLEAHRLAVAALALLDEPDAAVSNTAFPVLLRADVLAAAPGATLAEAAAECLVSQGVVAERSAAAVRDQIARGGAVLLIDALDEVPREAATAGGQAPRKRLEDLLRQWVERCPGRVRVMVASRLAGYTGPPVPGAREAELLPFTSSDIDAAVQAWDLPAGAANWLRGWLRDQAVARMARVPLLLALACSLAAGPDSRRQGLPHHRAGLYEAVVWQFLSSAHRAAEHGGPTPAVDAAGRQDLLRVLVHVAYRFASTKHGWVDRMSRGELLDAIRRAGDTLTGLGISAPAALEWLAGAAGILVPAGNPASAEQDYVFLHRTIAEYLVARYLRDLPAEDRMATIAVHQWFDHDWAEVFPMLGGLLAASDPDQAQALVAWFLSQRSDPLHYAFRMALRILGDIPAAAQVLTSAQERSLRRRASGLFANEATRYMLTSELTATGAWPAPVIAGLLSCLTYPNKDCRAAAARALAEHHAPEVTTALIARLTDRSSYVRAVAIKALAEHHAPEATTALIARLDSRSEYIRVSAAEALAQHHDPKATSALLACLTDRSGWVRKTAARALRGRDQPEVSTALINCLTDQDAQVREAATEALAGWDSPQITTVLLGCLTDHDGGVRAVATEALATRDASQAVTAVFTCLTDHHRQVRATAARALAGRNEPEVTTALLARLAHCDEAARAAAADALAGHDDHEATAGLVARLTDQAGEVRAAAAGALAGRDGPQVTAALIARLADDDGEVRQAAARALTGKDDPEVITALIRCLADQDAGVRSTAAKALSGRNEPEVASALLACLTDDSWWVRQAVTETLAGHAEPQITAALIARLTDKNLSVRTAAAEALSGRNDPGVTSALLTRLTDGSRHVRQAAADALTRRDDPAMLAHLTKPGTWLLREGQPQERFEWVSVLAERTYSRLAPVDRERIWRRLKFITNLVVRHSP